MHLLEDRCSPSQSTGNLLSEEYFFRGCPVFTHLVVHSFFNLLFYLFNPHVYCDFAELLISFFFFLVFFFFHRRPGGSHLPPPHTEGRGAHAHARPDGAAG